VGTTGEGYNFAEQFGINIIPPYKALWWVSTKKDLSELSWVSANIESSLIDTHTQTSIYSEFWPLLFTHFWVSGPIIFNLWNAIWEYLNHQKIPESEFETYILNYLSLKLTFKDEENIPKRVVKFFGLNEETKQVTLGLQNWRSWKEAKATWWGVDINELDKYMQTKKVPWLFFIGEVVDVTGKTWGFNLQWAWSSAFVASEWFCRKNFS
jgi:predicted flavoprotein YhiN